MFGGFFTKSNICQREGNNYQCKSNLSCNINIPECHIFFRSQKAKAKVTIPRRISPVNTTSLADGVIPGNSGPAIASPNQNTEKLINQSAMTESKIGSILSIAINITKAVLSNKEHHDFIKN